MSNASASHYPTAPVSQRVEQHTLCVLVDNEPGVLARVIGLFSGRGYNIDSLTVSETEHEKHLSRITIVTRGTPMVIEQIKNQLERIVPIHRVIDMTVAGPALQRSDEPSPGQVRRAIAAAVAAYGGSGCAARVAQAFGEHPETAVTRMRWARTLVARAIPATCLTA